MPKAKRIFLSVLDFSKAVVRYVSAPFRYPMRSAIFVSMVAIFYLVGLLYGERTGDGGVLSNVAEGIFVVHSAGGCILVEGGRYVSGTHTSDSSLCTP